MGGKKVTAMVGIGRVTEMECCGDMERGCLAVGQFTGDLFKMNARSLFKLRSFFDGLIFL